MPKKKDMIYKSIESLEPVVDIINEASAAVQDKSRTIGTSSMPEVLAGALGAGLGGVVSTAALYGLGTVGFSAAGITSGLATAGSLLGGGMVAGIFTLALPVAGLAGLGVGLAANAKNKKLKQEKERLYREALRKQEIILEEMKNEIDADEERIKYLQGINILLNKVIGNLKKDLGKD